MAIMMYIFDKSGNELANGVFGGNGSSPLRSDGSRDHSRRENCHFCGGARLTASDFGVDEIRVKTWGPGDGPGRRSIEWFTVGVA